MARKHKKLPSRERLSYTDIGLLLSVIFGLMDYVVFLRPAMGQYECGVMDCFLSVLLLVLVVLRITKKPTVRRQH
jgi:hypothetical protein